jgi:ubiquinol-cytochrome c reductase cytochrome b subunit
MAFTGQVLRFDEDAYWGLGIGASIASRVPILGPALVSLLMGGPIIGGATLSRFFALHVFVIPGLLMLFVALHVLLVLKLGINEWPMPGRLVRRSDYLEKYHSLTQTDGVPFVPYGVWKDAVFSGVILLAIARFFSISYDTSTTEPLSPANVLSSLSGIGIIPSRSTTPSNFSAIWIHSHASVLWSRG